MSLSHSNWKLAAAITTVAFASPAFADLVVNTNLGNVGAGALPFSGTTVGQVNDADTYSPPGNTAAIWDQDFVYQFTTAQSFLVTLNSNDPNGAIDNDFFLLNSLSTFVNANSLREATTVHDNLVEVSGSFGVQPAGTYYLSIDAWRGNPTVAGTPATGRAGPFSGTLTLTALTAPAATQAGLGGSLNGTLAPGAHDWYKFNYSGSGGFTIDTEGSVFTPDNDTELGLFNSAGALVASDDDGGSGLLSLITSPAGLPAGEYYLAIGGFNTTFASGFIATGGSNGGSYIINGLNTVPEPASLATLSLATALVARRRRH